MTARRIATLIPDASYRSMITVETDERLQAPGAVPVLTLPQTASR